MLALADPGIGTDPFATQSRYRPAISTRSRLDSSDSYYATRVESAGPYTVSHLPDWHGVSRLVALDLVRHDITPLPKLKPRLNASPAPTNNFHNWIMHHPGAD